MRALRCGLIAVCLSAWTTLAAAQDDNPLKAVTEKYIAAYNKGGTKESIAFWAEDADYTTTEGEIFRGREAIRQLMSSEGDAAPGTKLKISEQIVRVIKPDVAIQDGVLEFAAPDGVTERSRFTAVWAKNNGQWQLSSVRDLGPLVALVATDRRENPIDQLSALSGEWIANDDFAQVQMRGEWMLGKQFFRFDYDFKPKAGDPFTVLQVIGWDPVDESLRSWVFDSHGGHGSGVWSKTPAGWSVLSTGVTPAGQVGTGTYIYAVSGKSLMLDITAREVAGQRLPDAHVKFARP